MGIKSFSRHKAKLLVDGKYREIKTIHITESNIIITYDKDITPANELFVNSQDEFSVEGGVDF